MRVKRDFNDFKNNLNKDWVFVIFKNFSWLFGGEIHCQNVARKEKKL